MSGMPCCSFVPIDPGAAVHVQQHGRAAVRYAGGGGVDVEQAAAAVPVVVHDVALRADLGAAHPERIDEPAPRYGEVGRRRRGVELLGVVETEPFGEGFLGLGAHASALVDEERQTGDVRRCEGEAEAAPTPAGRVRSGVGRGQGEHVRASSPVSQPAMKDGIPAR